MRDHQPVPIDDFNGLWDRGGEDTCPIDHFTDLNNLLFDQNSTFVRKPFARYINTLGFNPGRIVNYVNNNTNKSYFLILDPTGGNLYSMQISPTILAPQLILNLPGMTDFGYFGFNGRAYISPSNGLTGISGALVQVWDGVIIYPAAGQIPIAPALAGAAGGAGADTTLGDHYFGVAYLTKSGFITPFAVAPRYTVTAAFLGINGVPAGPVGTIGRYLVMTKVLPASITSPDQANFYFAAFLADNISNTFTATLPTIPITFNIPRDSLLIESADYLQGLAQKIDAGVFITAYHNRAVYGGAILDSSVTAINIFTPPVFPPALSTPVVAKPSVLKFSIPGDPESIDRVQGIIEIDPSHATTIVDINGTQSQIGCTAGQEYRDTFYVGKISKFYAINDNGNEPASWTPITLDEGIGCYPYGIATVLDTGGVNIDSFFTMDKTGIYLFNGLFQKPEVTWKIADLWSRVQKTYNPGAVFSNLTHFVNDSVAKRFYILCQFRPLTIPFSPFPVNPPVVPDTILICDYKNTQTNDAEFYKNVKWSKWVLNTVNFNPSNLILFDDGNKVSLIAFSLADQRGWLYDGTDPVKEIVFGPFFDTAMVGDEESNVNHIGGLRMIISSETNSVVTPSVINRDGTRKSDLFGLTIPANPGLESTFLANVMGQRMKVRIKVPDNGTFDVGKVVIFVKPIYASLPI